MVQVNDVRNLNSTPTVEAKKKDLEYKTKGVESVFSSSVEIKSTSYGYSENHIRDLEEKIKAKKEELAIYKNDFQNGTDKFMEQKVRKERYELMKNGKISKIVDKTALGTAGAGGGLVLIGEMSKLTKKMKLTKFGLGALVASVGIYLGKEAANYITPIILSKTKTKEGSSLNNFYKETLPSRIKYAEKEIAELEKNLAEMKQ